jgi:hypothetical protein
LEGETEVLGENLPQCSFVQYKSHMTRAWTQATVVGTRCPTAWAREWTQSTVKL